MCLAIQDIHPVHNESSMLFVQDKYADIQLLGIFSDKDQEIWE